MVYGLTVYITTFSQSEKSEFRAWMIRFIILVVVYQGSQYIFRVQEVNGTLLSIFIQGVASECWHWLLSEVICDVISAGNCYHSTWKCVGSWWFLFCENLWNLYLKLKLWMSQVPGRIKLVFILSSLACLSKGGMCVNRVQKVLALNSWQGMRQKYKNNILNFKPWSQEFLRVKVQGA